MFKPRTFLMVASGAAAATLLAGVVSLIAAAPAAGPGYASVVGPAFQPRFTSTNFSYFHMQVRTESGTGYFVAPVSLPQGAILNQMTLLGYDDDPSNKLEVIFYRAFAGRGFIEEIATLDSTGANGDFELSTTPDSTRAVVDNERYGYFVELTLPAPSASNKGLDLTRVRLGYRFAQNLPMILRDFRRTE